MNYKDEINKLRKDVIRLKLTIDSILNRNPELKLTDSDLKKIEELTQIEYLKIYPLQSPVYNGSVRPSENSKDIFILAHGLETTQIMVEARYMDNKEKITIDPVIVNENEVTFKFKEDVRNTTVELTITDKSQRH